MPQMNRRDFFRHAALAGLTLSVVSPLASTFGCESSTVNPMVGNYDVIIVGGGTAGAIVAAKLGLASGGKKRILIIEAGGPTSAAVGGDAWPAWLPPGRRDLTVFDVPGEYSLMAFQPLGAPYQLTETPFTFQGIGLGGNSMFNGMLFQTNTAKVFDNSWPEGWHWSDMAPYFDRVRQRVPVTNKPSTDGIPQNTGPAKIVHPLYAASGSGWVEGDTSQSFDGAGTYSRPYVAASKGLRAGPLTGYFAEAAPRGRPSSRLDILPWSKVTQIEFDKSGQAVAVHFNHRNGLDQSQPGIASKVGLKSGGLLVMAAGALITPRLLLLSGVGPQGREPEFFPGQSPANFSIDNPMVGVGLYDHVMTMITYSYDGQVPYRAYNYADFSGNHADLQQYLDSGRGPYAQYQPVSILNYDSVGSGVPDIEIFLNPNGAGTPGGPYYGPNTFCAYVMLLNPKARGLVTLDKNGNVNYPGIYLPDTPDGQADTTLMAQAVFNMIQLFAREPGLKIAFGPGSASHPNLNPNSLADIKHYVTGPNPVDNVYFNRLIINHYGGTVALSDGPGGVDPTSLIVRGTKNVAVVDASLIPTVVPAHPVGTIMAVADRAGDILSSHWL